MKILYIANARIPTEKAHGIQIMKMCEGLSVAGIEVELLVPTRRNKELGKADPFDFYKVINNFKITKVPSLDPTFLFLFPSGFYIKFQAAFFMFSLFLYLIFKKGRSGFIFYTRDDYLLPLLQFFSKRVVWEGHNLPKNTKYYLKFWRRCYKIVTITDNLKQALIEKGIKADRILVSPDAVDLKEFSKITETKEQLRKKLSLPLDKNLIIYAGHLYSWKGAQILAEAAKKLTEQELVIFIGGTDSDLADFRQKNEGIAQILILGYKNHLQIPAYLKAADVLVLPNSAKQKNSTYYTSPMKLFEYMAAQKPIIASNLPSLREILNENNSVLVKPDNAEALAQGIKSILADDTAAQKISSQAFNDVKRYTWSERVKNIINVI